MAFDTKKREYLVKRLGEAKVVELEKDTAAMSKALEELGVEYKEKGSDPAPQTPDVESALEAVKTALNVDGLQKVLTGLLASNKALTEELTTLKVQLAEVKKSDDDKVAETIAPKIKPIHWGYQPSQAKDNIVSEADKAKLKGADGPSWVQEAFGAAPTQ